MSFAKKHKKAIIAVSVVAAVIVLCVVGFVVYLYTLPLYKDIKYDRAIAIAKKEFKLEKVLWITDHPEILSSEPNDELYKKTSGSYNYGIVGIKDGEEIFIIVPSNPKSKKPFITTWGLDYSFAQIAEKFNECSAQYVADVPDDYYSLGHSSYIQLSCDEPTLDAFAKIYIGNEIDELYERLDINAVFEYRWKENGIRHDCMVTQEKGELKAYTSY